MKSVLFIFFIFVLASTNFRLVTGSRGDQDPIFQSCLTSCRQDNCKGPNPNNNLSFFLRLTLWSCSENCAYECMHRETNRRRNNHQEVLQYYGKWPFTRILGITEPASVVFSVLNGYAHYHGFKRLQKELPIKHFMVPFYLYNAAFGLNSWIWSIVYHTRDLPITEKLDYFAAGASIFYAVLYCILKTYELYHGRIAAFLGISLLIGYGFHIRYLLSTPRFDYSYNIMITAGIGIFQNILWLMWSIRNWKTRPHAYKMTGIVIALITAMSLEIFDFAPIMELDAHALWHAATIPIIFKFYDFLIEDTKWELVHGLQ